MERIEVTNGGERLDVYLAKHFERVHTRSQITNSIKNGKTLLNGKAVKAGTVLRVGDTIKADIEKDTDTAVPEEIPIDIVYEDEYLMIINKPRGLIVHPGAGNKSGTLLNGLLYYAQNKRKSRRDADEQSESEVERAGIVHRLDKNTAGLMLAAKTAACQAKLATMFERHEVKRTYLGLVEGVLTGEGTIDKNIIRDPSRRTLFKTTASGGRHAVTHYKVIKNFSKWTLVQFNLETGRTHQIRVHGKAIGHALVGDPEYNTNSSIKCEGQLLESVGISFTHPITQELISFKTEPTEQFQTIFDKLN